MKKNALIICNGEAPSKKLAQRLARTADIIVAADGGANVARKLGIHPDIVIGDLDSITPATKRYFSSHMKRLSEGLHSEKPLQDSSGLLVPRPKGQGYTRFIRITRQDNTDLEKAMDFLLEKNIKRATIIAATGKRLDHTLGNLSVMWNYTSKMQIEFVGEGWCAFPIAKKKKVSAKVGTTVSLVPFGVCSGITLKGLYYRLKNARMGVGEIGVSNIVSKSPFSVEVGGGKMLMIVLAQYSSIKIVR